MLDLRNGDCLEILKDIPSKTIDLVFADLPYGQINCKWDCKIDLELLWKELLRVAKSDHTPFFFTATTKFGYELIKSNEKMFKYDLVWAKSNPCGFLQAKKQPMRKHEMLYVFYKKQPAYDISSHKHKFKKEENYDPPLPTSVIKEDNCYNKGGKDHYEDYKTKLGYANRKNGESAYDPPLPVSVIKEEQYTTESSRGEKTYGKYSEKANREAQLKIYDPPLPTSLLEIKSVRLKQHSTAKPPDLMKWILKYYSKEGDTILDPTMGSNPMGLACKEMNRKFIGIEMDETIYNFACDRVK